MSKKHIKPDATDHPWERIFSQDGHVFTEELPAQKEFIERFKQAGIHQVLDLGCGNGRHVVALPAQGFEVIGVEISKTGLDLTRRWLQESGLTAHLLQTDSRHPLPLKEGSIAGLISTQVIHHAYRVEVFLAIDEIHRILRPGGLAFVTVPSGSRSNRKSKRIERHTYLPLEGSEAGLPHHIFSKRRLRQAFSLFNIHEISYRDNGRILAIWAEKQPE
jgi:SAM-dependent methyltransferase